MKREAGKWFDLHHHGKLNQSRARVERSRAVGEVVKDTARDETHAPHPEHRDELKDEVSGWFDTSVKVRTVFALSAYEKHIATSAFKSRQSIRIIIYIEALETSDRAKSDLHWERNGVWVLRTPEE